MNGRPTRVDLPAATAIKVISDTILGYIKQGVPVRDAVSRAFRELGVQIPEEKFEWLCNYYQTEIDRLKEAQETQGLKVVGGQVVETMHDDDYAEKHGKDGR